MHSKEEFSKMEKASKQENPNVPPVSEAFLLLHLVEDSLHKESVHPMTSGHFLCWANPGFN